MKKTEVQAGRSPNPSKRGKSREGKRSQIPRKKLGSNDNEEECPGPPPHIILTSKPRLKENMRKMFDTPSYAGEVKWFCSVMWDANVMDELRWHDQLDGKLFTQMAICKLLVDTLRGDGESWPIMSQMDWKQGFILLDVVSGEFDTSGSQRSLRVRDKAAYNIADPSEWELIIFDECESIGEELKRLYPAVKTTVVIWNYEKFEYPLNRNGVRGEIVLNPVTFNQNILSVLIFHQQKLDRGRGKKMMTALPTESELCHLQSDQCRYGISAKLIEHPHHFVLHSWFDGSQHDLLNPVNGVSMPSSGCWDVTVKTCEDDSVAMDVNASVDDESLAEVERWESQEVVTPGNQITAPIDLRTTSDKNGETRNKSLVPIMDSPMEGLGETPLQVQLTNSITSITNHFVQSENAFRTVERTKIENVRIVTEEESFPRLDLNARTFHANEDRTVTQREEHVAEAGLDGVSSSTAKDVARLQRLETIGIPGETTDGNDTIFVSGQDHQVFVQVSDKELPSENIEAVSNGETEEGSKRKIIRSERSSSDSTFYHTIELVPSSGDDSCRESSTSHETFYSCEEPSDLDHLILMASQDITFPDDDDSSEHQIGSGNSCQGEEM